MHWMKGTGIHAATPKYKWGKKTVNAGWVTTFSEYSVVSENRVTKIPDDYDLKTATLYGCAITTAFGVIHNDAKVKCGESIVIFGAGGVGSAIIQAASVSGAYPVIAVDVNDYKLKMASKFGAAYVINGKIQDAGSEIIKIIGGAGADVTVDTTGINKIRELAYEIAAPWGRTILVGVPRHGEKMSIDSFPLHFDKVLTGSHGGDCNPTYDIPRLIGLERSGRIDLTKMITKIYPLEKINEALSAVRTGDVIRVAVKM
jgi:S-(hydroxymethyl)glutathione dehydrogenase / alcohol dehydrogenase